MSLKVEKLEHNMAKLTVEATAEELDKAIQSAYLKMRNQISIPGFRKGKASRVMIEKMFGKSVFYEEAANILIPDAYSKALSECEEEIVSQPSIEVTQIEAGKPFIFTAEVALKPAVELGEYKGIKVPAADISVSEDEIQGELNREREANGRTVAVEGRPIQDGDTAVIDFKGFIDDEPFAGGEGENHPLVIGSGAFIPGFEEQLIGKNAGDECDVNVSFPEDYHAEELKGRAAVFKVKIQEIKEKILPELDDEFAGEVSEFDTLEEYRADIEKKLRTQKENRAKADKEDAVIRAIIDNANMDIPEAMIETQQRQLVDDFAQRIRMQGLTLEKYFEYTGTNTQALMEQMKPQAENRIKSRLVLEAVAAAENIEVSEDDYEAEIVRMAGVYGMEPDKVKEMIGDSEEAKKQIRDDLAITKAIELVTESATEE